MQLTDSTKAKKVKRNWHLIDAKDKILGRVASEIAMLLMGKNKPYFVRHLDCGDHVVVVNVALIKTTGKKEKNKIYHRHSGYPGGKKEIKMANMRISKPLEILRKAVKGMLPQNKLMSRMLKRLHLFADDSHHFMSKFI